MALTKCPDCGKEVSSRAPSCPNCGAPIAADSIANPKTVHGRGEGIFMKSMNCGCMVMLAFVIFVVVMMGVQSSQDAERPAATVPE